jgi:hypothetical protein
MKGLAQAEEKRLKNNATCVSPAPYRAIHACLVKRYWPVIALFALVENYFRMPVIRALKFAPVLRPAP